MNDKNSLRKYIKEIRKTLDIEQISSLIVSNIRSMQEYVEANKVMIFYPLVYEIDLRDLLTDDKEFYLPRMSGKQLECCSYNKNDILEVAKFSVKEPTSDSVDKNLMDIIFVPALCVDNNCMRLGYGKGYYDRFLSDYKGLTIIPIPDELVYDDVCANSNDVACKKVVTQKRVFNSKIE